MKRLSCLLALFVLWVVTSSAAAGPKNSSLALTLNQALQMARVRQVDTIVASERVQQAMERMGEARSALFPQLKATASQTRLTRNLEAFGVTIPGQDPLVGPFNSLDARVAVTQVLLDAQAFQRLKSARIERQLSLSESRQATEDAMALVASLYIEAMRAKDLVTVAQAQLDLAEKEKTVTRHRTDLGLGSSFDVTQANSELESSRRRLAQTEADAIERRLDLAAAINLPMGEEIDFVRKDRIVAKVPSKQEIHMAVSSHPDVETANIYHQLSLSEKSVQKADYVPTITAMADYGLSGRDPTSVDDTYSFGGQLTFPLFLGGLRRHRIKEAEAGIREQAARLSATSRETEAKALGAREVLLQTVSVLKAAEAKYIEAAKALQLARQRLDTGLGSELELAGAKADAAVALDGKREAAATYRLAEVALAHAMGRLGAKVEEHN